MSTAPRRRVTGYPSTSGDDVQLNTTTLIRHAARTHGDQEIVYRTPDGVGPLHVRRGLRTDPPRRERHDRPRRQPRRPRGRHRLEQSATLRALLGDPRHRRDDGPGESPPRTRRPRPRPHGQRVHHGVRGRVPAAPRRGHRPASAGGDHVGGDDGPPPVRDRDDAAGRAALRGPPGLGLPGRRLAGGRGDLRLRRVLHHRHDRPAEGGVLLAPRDRAALVCPGRLDRHDAPGRHHDHHPHVPRPGLGPPAGRHPDGEQDRPPRPLHGGGHRPP